MAKFDLDDFAGRLIRLVPTIWFSSTARKVGGNFYALAAGLGEGLAFLYQQTQTLKANSRILTTQDINVLALASQDLFGAGVLPPLANESASAYRTRILARLFLPGGTRAGIIQAVTNLTGKAPIAVVEPWNPTDCGAWDMGNAAWDTAGRWGAIDMPWQGFVVVQRPTSVASNGQPYYAAFDVGGWDQSTTYYPDLTTTQTIPDSAIYKAINDAKPIGTTVWVQIQ